MTQVKLHPDRIIQYGLCVVMAAGIYILGYFTERTDHALLIALLTICFITAFGLYKSAMPVVHLLAFGVFLRLILIFMFPNLSDDVYRFIWDGQLLASGLDPFEYLPSEIASSGNFPGKTSQALYELLNSPDYFTVYPPLMQYIFLLSAKTAGGDIFQNVLFLRTLIVLSEMGILILCYRMAPENRNLLFYALNPSVILEFTGNLHFESLMLLCLVLCIWFYRNKPIPAGMMFGFAASVKLVPLIFGPIILFAQQPRRSIQFFGTGLIIMLIVALPLFGNGILAGMGNSLALYFNKFEFNASLYYLIRAVGFWRFGYNDIAFIGPFLAWTSLLVIIFISFRLRRIRGQYILSAFGIILTVYLFLSTTVHPWYVATAAGLMVFSRLRYAFVWSFTAMFSYIGYMESGYNLNEFWLVLEYFLVLFVLLLDIRDNKLIYET